jgi:AcrR family transcriptional regulator
VIQSQGLRERKKQRTRQLLVATAFRLFEEKGYEQTTVAEVAAAAEVSTKTFFNYFPSKEDVVFADASQRMDVALQVVAERAPFDPLDKVLLQVIERVLDLVQSHDSDLEPDLLAVRAKVLMAVPALQAKALHLIFAMQRQLAQALAAAYPDRLDEVTAAAVVGSVVGAAQAAVLASIERGDSRDESFAAVCPAARIALQGIESFGQGER